MLQTSARLLRLLTMLQARRSWTGADLSEHLKITDRTLRRDVDRLRSLGYPVQSTSGIAGGYSLGAGASLPPLMLDDDEAVAVALGLQAASSGSISGMDTAAIRALSKLEQVLPTRLRKRLQSMSASIVRVKDSAPAVELHTVSALASACADRVEAQFAYKSYTGAPTARTVEPHQLVHLDRRWYLVAWDRERDDWRTFRVDRIALPVTLGAPFTARSAPGDGAADYVHRNVTAGPYRHHARVLVHAPRESLQAHIPPSAGRLETVTPQSCRFYTAGNSLEHIATWLSMLDAEFVIEHPPELVSALQRVAARLERAARSSRSVRPPA